MTDNPDEPTPEQENGRAATVRIFGEHPSRWHLVEYGTWQISVAPDGLLMLPRHLHPVDVQDFVSCALAAAQVGAKVVAENTDNLMEVGPPVPMKPIITPTGEDPPPGAVKMVLTERQAAAARGAPARARRRDPRQPPAPQPVQPPTPGD
jgi:hypothetical protein